MAENTSPIQVYIENARSADIGGFTIPLPTTREAMAPWLAAIEVNVAGPDSIEIVETRSSIPQLGRVLQQTDYSLDELNYLAAKIKGMDDNNLEAFLAALESGKHNESIKDTINLTENLEIFDLQPAFSPHEYGAFHVNLARDEYVDIMSRLATSADPAERDFFTYIAGVEAHIDLAAYGKFLAENEGGMFTEQGYLIESSGFREAYRGSEDIPLEYRIFTQPIMVAGVDMPSFLAQLHALAGDYSRDAEHNISVLSELRSAEYLLLMDGAGAFLTESTHAYRQGTDAFNRWMNTSETHGAQAFSIHLTEVHGGIEGDVAEVNIAERQRDIRENCIQPVTVETTMPSGEIQSYLPHEWDALDQIDRDGVQDWRRVFEDGDFSKVYHHLDHLRGQTEAACRHVPASEFLVGTNTVYMKQAQCPQPEMLRVSQIAAKEMLARGDCEVYRLLPKGAEKLSPTDAIKSGLWFSEHREFAIRREDMAGLQKWAERSGSDAINRVTARDEHKKTYGSEL